MESLFCHFLNLFSPVRNAQYMYAILLRLNHYRYQGTNVVIAVLAGNLYSIAIIILTPSIPPQGTWSCWAE